MLISDLLSFGDMANEITGSGIYMEVMVRLIPRAANVSPEAQSIPNKAPINPAGIHSISSICSACMRASLPILTFFPVRTL